MSDRYAQYTREIIAAPCSTCGKKSPDRCRGSIMSGLNAPPHAARIAAAGYRWNRKTRKLEALGDRAGEIQLPDGKLRESGADQGDGTGEASEQNGV